jgi:hypothetical protein
MPSTGFPVLVWEGLPELGFRSGKLVGRCRSEPFTALEVGVNPQTMRKRWSFLTL